MEGNKLVVSGFAWLGMMLCLSFRLPFLPFKSKEERVKLPVRVFSWRSGRIIQAFSILGTKGRCLREYSGRYYCNTKVV